jgi:dGTPase
MVALSQTGAVASRAIKAFLFEHMYRHPRLVRMRHQAAAIVTDLAEHFMAHPDDLPAALEPPAADLSRRVADHIAGLTDRGAVAWHRRLFARTPDLV